MKTKQVLSVADLATILDLVNRAITTMESEWCYPIRVKEYSSKKEYQEALNESLKELKEDPYYQSVIHLKKALENLNVEIETPELEIEGQKNETD